MDQIIFFSKNRIVFTESPNKYSGTHLDKNTTNTENMLGWIKEIILKDRKDLIIICENPDNELNKLKEQMIHLKAGGGLVYNDKNNILFIFRKGKWDLPKGKPEVDETIEETAIREVKEECGIGGLEIIKPLPSTYHIYQNSKDQYILKQSDWFEMRSYKWQNVLVQYEEEITDYTWSDTPVSKNLLQKAFPSIAYLIDRLGLS